MPTAVDPAGDDEPGADVATLTASLREAGVVRTDHEAAAFGLWLDGERRTEVVATSPELASRPLREEKLGPSSMGRSDAVHALVISFLRLTRG